METLIGVTSGVLGLAGGIGSVCLGWTLRAALDDDSFGLNIGCTVLLLCGLVGAVSLLLSLLFQAL